MSSYRSDIDGLRAVAIVPVVLFHAGFSVFSGGFVGVDVFFVISGYLITQVLHRELTAGRFSLIGFYERRARRILPALTALMFACLGFGYFFLLPADFERLSGSTIAATLFSSNFWFWQAANDYFAVGAEFEPLLHTWTLSVEEQFYLLFPLLLALLARRSARMTIWVIGLITLLSFGLSVIGVATYPSAAFYLLPTRAWELGLGCLIALGLEPDLKRSWLREGLSGAGLAAILLATLTFDSSTPFPGLAALLPCLGAAALIVAGGQGSSFVGRLLSSSPFVFTGLISYSLYLWHWPLLAFLRIYKNSNYLPARLALPVVAASFAMAAFSWAVIERPFRRRPPKGFERATIFGLSGAAAASILALSLPGVVNGLPARFDPLVALADAEAEDINPDRERCLDVWPDDGLCHFGASTDPNDDADFLLWGDSHASAIMPGIANAARLTDKVGVFAGHVGCPPLLGVERVDLASDHDCADFNQQVFDELQARTDASLVILMARWYLTAEGYRAENERGVSTLLSWADKPNAGHQSPERNFGIFRQAIADTVAAIRATGRRVIIVGGVPEIGWDVPRGIADHLRWGQPLPPVPTISRIRHRQKRTDAVLAGLAESTETLFLPLAYLLCHPVCETVVEGRPLYRDGDHLSRYGAEEVIEPLFTELWD